MTSPSIVNSNSFISANGSNVLITGGSFVQSNDTTRILDPLYNKVSTNAILNRGGRADTVRCYPGTREEVIAKIEKWHRADHSKGHPIFWLSGPAGAGKSAIVQTIAERCIEEKVPMVNFFFFRADATRNHSEPVVATLLFQLFKLFPALKSHVADIVVENPVIWREPLQEQFSTLIEKPLGALRLSSGQGPPVILIDGLDECSSGDGKKDQSSLLRILHDITTKVDPAFIVLVASRTEAHLTMTFNAIGISPYSIYLDDSYRPLDDIRQFLVGEFSRIRATHSLKDTLDTNWPPTADFDSILNKSSGQFVYAATVTRFIADSAASPKRSLEIVLGLRPVTKTSPFATLDSLYTYILSQADDWNAVHDILAARKVGSDSTRYLTAVLRPLDYTNDDILSNLSDLTAIIKFKAGDNDLTVYHASLDDFLYDSARAGMFYVDVNAFSCKLVPFHFKRILNLWGLKCGFDILRSVTEPNHTLDEFLISYVPNIALPDSEEDQSQIENCMNNLKKVYQARDPLLYESIRNHWQEWFDNVRNTSKDTQTDSHVIESHTPNQTPPTQPAQPPSIAPFRRLLKFPWKRNRKT